MKKPDIIERGEKTIIEMPGTAIVSGRRLDYDLILKTDKTTYYLKYLKMGGVEVYNHNLKVVCDNRILKSIFNAIH